jgi:pimeloyl-ACP methyl ester carboxylesterase
MSSTAPAIPIFRTAEQRAAMMAIYDDKLRHWPVAFETLVTPTRFGTTHIIASGPAEAPPLILLHPLAVAGFVWAAIIEPLATRHRTYILDTIGDIGRSELADPHRYPRRGGDYSDWLGDVYEQLDITAANVVAGSMGGWIALQHAIHAPQRVRRLVLLGPMGVPSWAATLKIVGPLMSLALRPTQAKADTLIRRGIGDGERVNREMLEWMRLAGKGKPRMGKPWPMSNDQLRRVRAPTLLFLGGKDGAIGSAEAAADRARSNIPDCEVVVLPDAGHLMMIDQPGIVGPRIVDFLDPPP